MALTIELTPEEEARLDEAAGQAGLRPEAYLRRVLGLPPPKPTGTAAEQHRASAEEIIRELDEMAEGNDDLPGLPPEAFDRENLYEDRL